MSIKVSHNLSPSLGSHLTSTPIKGVLSLQVNKSVRTCGVEIVMWFGSVLLFCSLWVGLACATDHVRVSYMGQSNSGLFSADSPSIAYNHRDNQFLIVWRGNDISGTFFDNKFEIFAQRMDATNGQLLGEVFQVSAMGPSNDPAFDAESPHVVYNSQANEYLVVWGGDSNQGELVNGEFEIYGQRIEARRGVLVGSALRISDMGVDGDSSADASDPKLAYNPRSNTYLVVWSGDNDNGEQEIYGQLLDATGVEIGRNDFRISDIGEDGNYRYAAKSPALTFNPISGEYLVVWRGEDSTRNSYDIFQQRLDSRDGSERGLNDQQISDNGHNAQGVDVVFDSFHQSYLVTWIAASSRTVRAQRIDGPSGVEIGMNDFLISTNVHQMAKTPRVSYNAVNQEFLIIWEGTNVAGLTANFYFFRGDREVFGQLISAESGERVGDSSFQISQMGPDGVSFFNAHSADVIYNPLYNEYLLTWAGTDEQEDLATNEKEIFSTMLYKVETPIDSDGDGIRNGRDTDDDNDGVSDIDEAALGTDITSRDTDRDGIDDGQEILDGSDPLDSGSAVEVLSTEVCAEWNGFLGGMWNIAEHVNLSAQTRHMNIALEGQAARNIAVLPGAQTDALVHSMQGWSQNDYGKVCSRHDGQAGDVDGRMVHYKYTDGGFDFAFAMPFSNGLRGRQYVFFNTYQPSMNPQDTGNLVTNWIQVTSLADTAERGELVFFATDGRELSRQDVVINGRYDFPAHQFGVNQVGLVEWIPQSGTAKFQLRNVRYFYDNPWGIERFDAATQLEGKRGSARELVAPLDTTEGTAVVELGNTRALETIVAIDVYNEAGLLAYSDRIYLAPHATAHVIADPYLQGGRGSVHIDANDAIIAQVMHYGRNEQGSIEFLYGASAKEPLGTVLRGSYNTFLNQGCQLRIVNASHLPQRAQVTLTRYDGTEVLNGESIEIKAQATVFIDACSSENQEAYGVVSVHASESNTLMTDMLRTSIDYRFSTPLRQ